MYMMGCYEGQFDSVPFHLGTYKNILNQTIMVNGLKAMATTTQFIEMQVDMIPD